MSVWNRVCYDPLLLLIAEIRNVTIYRGFRMNYGTVQLMEDHGKPTPPPAGGYGAPDPAFMPDEIEQQILDFLDGKTHGEELLHALHDHVLDEPIPERMLVLLRQACSAEPEPTEAGAWSALSATRA